MKTIAIAIMLVIFTATGAYGSESNACEHYAGMAEAIMEVRQDGTPKQELIDLVNRNATSESQRDLAILMIIEAYEIPRGETPEERELLVKLFRKAIYEACKIEW